MSGERDMGGGAGPVSLCEGRVRGGVPVEGLGESSHISASFRSPYGGVGAGLGFKRPVVDSWRTEEGEDGGRDGRSWRVGEICGKSKIGECWGPGEVENFGQREGYHGEVAGESLVKKRRVGSERVKGEMWGVGEAGGGLGTAGGSGEFNGPLLRIPSPLLQQQPFAEMLSMVADEGSTSGKKHPEGGMYSAVLRSLLVLGAGEGSGSGSGSGDSIEGETCGVWGGEGRGEAGGGGREEGESMFEGKLWGGMEFERKVFETGEQRERDMGGLRESQFGLCEQEEQLGGMDSWRDEGGSAEFMELSESCWEKGRGNLGGVGEESLDHSLFTGLGSAVVLDMDPILKPPLVGSLGGEGVGEVGVGPYCETEDCSFGDIGLTSAITFHAETERKLEAGRGPIEEGFLELRDSLEKSESFGMNAGTSEGAELWDECVEELLPTPKNADKLIPSNHFFLTRETSAKREEQEEEERRPLLDEEDFVSEGLDGSGGGGGLLPRKLPLKICRVEECTKGARGPSGLCIGHGGGRRCVSEGCTKGAEGRTDFCKGHGGGKRCSFDNCKKSAEGRTSFCIAHGGGKRCAVEGCQRSARGGTDHCIRHGGGKRCTAEGCTKSAEGLTGRCISHGGGKRCQFPDCTKSAQGGTSLCKAHGGGRRCYVAGCRKGAEGKGDPPLCKGHGGGRRCEFGGGGLCGKSVHSGTRFCVAHGGGKRCSFDGCGKSARGRTSYCVRHGGGRRCAAPDCSKSAQGSTNYCKSHGGGKRCPWVAQPGQLPCGKFARAKSGLCTTHHLMVEQSNNVFQRVGFLTATLKQAEEGRPSAVTHCEGANWPTDFLNASISHGRSPMALLGTSVKVEAVGVKGELGAMAASERSTAGTVDGVGTGEEQRERSFSLNPTCLDTSLAADMNLQSEGSKLAEQLRAEYSAIVAASLMPKSREAPPNPADPLLQKKGKIQPLVRQRLADRPSAPTRRNSVGSQKKGPSKATPVKGKAAGSTAQRGGRGGVGKGPQNSPSPQPHFSSSTGPQSFLRPHALPFILPGKMPPLAPLLQQNSASTNWDRSVGKFDLRLGNRFLQPSHQYAVQQSAKSQFCQQHLPSVPLEARLPPIASQWGPPTPSLSFPMSNLYNTSPHTSQSGLHGTCQEGSSLQEAISGPHSFLEGFAKMTNCGSQLGNNMQTGRGLGAQKPLPMTHGSWSEAGIQHSQLRMLTSSHLNELMSKEGASSVAEAVSSLTVQALDSPSEGRLQRPHSFSPPPLRSTGEGSGDFTRGSASEVTETTSKGTVEVVSKSKAEPEKADAGGAAHLIPSMVLVPSFMVGCKQSVQGGSYRGLRQSKD